MVPENWFFERDTGTKTKKQGAHKVLMMPPASEEKKRMWKEEVLGQKRKRSTSNGIQENLKRFQSDCHAERQEILTMLEEVRANLDDNEFDCNVTLFKRLAIVTNRMKRKYLKVEKYAGAVELTEGEEMTEAVKSSLHKKDDEEDDDDHDKTSSHDLLTISIVEEPDDDVPISTMAAAVRLIELAGGEPADPAGPSPVVEEPEE